MELELQRYLRGGGTTADLAATRGINVYRHPTLPLVGFKYGPLSFPKTDPIIRDCQGLVLKEGTWDVVGWTIRRFFKATDDPATFALFRWDDFTATTREDRFLILVYHYAGAWHVNTSESFGQGLCVPLGKTWTEMFWQTARIDRDQLDPGLSYVFEMWTPLNSKVRIDDRLSAFLLTVFELGGREQTVAEADEWATRLGVPRPMHHHFTSFEEIRAYMAGIWERRMAFEATIVRDCNDRRLKIECFIYLRISEMGSKEILKPRRLVGLALSSTLEEVIAYLPELRQPVEQAQARMDAGYDEMLQVWRETWQIPVKKEFAMAIARRTPFASLLFQMRHHYGTSQTEALLLAAWLQSTDLIVKHLF